MKSRTLIRIGRLAAAGLLTCAAVSPAWADYPNTVLAKQPVAYWRLNETNVVPPMGVMTNYGSAVGADGILYNGGANVASPIAGTPSDVALKMDGVSQKIQLPYVADLNPASALSVEAWVRPLTQTNINDTYYRAIVRSGGQNWGGGYMLQYNALAGSDAGIFKFVLYNSSGGFEVYNTNFLSGTNFNIFATNDVWFHMVGTWSSSDNKGHLYVNGIEMTNMNPGTVGGISYTPTTTSFLRIGADDTSPTTPVGNHQNPGSTAHVAVYNYQMSQAQAATHYQAGLSASSNYVQTVLNDTPVGYWKLNEANIPAMPVAVNQGVGGATLNGNYCFATTPGVGGPTPPNYTGLALTNTGVYITNTSTGIGDGGFVLVPPVRGTNDSTNMTIVAFIKPNGPQLASSVIYGRRIIGNEKSAFQLDSTGTALGYNWDDTSAQFNFSSGFPLLDNQWCLAAVVITPTNAVVYLDTGSGLQAATNNTANVTKLGFTHQCYIGIGGGNFANSTRGFNGSVDEVAVWTNSLSRQDLLDLREAWIGSGLFIAQNPTARPVMLGGRTKFATSAGGSTNVMPFSYQLKRNGQPIGSPSTSSTLFYTNVQQPDLASSFSVAVLTNGVPCGLESPGVGLTRWTFPGTYSALVESYQPTAYYRFSESGPGKIYDIANTYDGVTNALASPAAGPQPSDGADYGFETPNNSYFFNGNGGGGGGAVTLSASGITFPDPLATRVSVALWIYPTASQIPFSGIYYTRATDYASLEFGPSGGYELGVAWASGSGNYNTHTAVFVNPNVWNFVAMVVTNNGATFYSWSAANGWQSNTIAGTFSPNRNMTGGTGTCIGTDPNVGLNRGVKGRIDEVAVFSRILTWDDVQKFVVAGANVSLAITPAGGNNVNVGWSYGTLESAGSVAGPWSPVSGASAPSFTTNSLSGQQYFRASY